MNQHLQMQLKKVLDQSNLEHTVNQVIQNKISPLQQQLSDQILKLSSLNTASNKGMNVDELYNKIQSLEESISNLGKQIENLM